MMKKIIILFLILSNISLAQKNPFGEVKVSSKKYYEEIEFTTVAHNMIIPVDINGKTFRFLVDTGAPNGISKRVFEELNLESIQKSDKPFLISITDASNLKDSLRIVDLPTLKIGNTSFENTKGFLLDFDNHYFMKCFKIDGFIGSNLFVKSVVKFSTKDNKIYITEKVKNFEPKTKPTKMFLHGVQSAPHLKVNYVGKDGKKANENLLIDTGASGFHDLSKRVFEILNPNDFYTSVFQSEGMGGVGLYEKKESETHYSVIIPSFEINQTVFENLQSTTTEGTTSRVGMQILDNGDMILDFKKKKFYYESFSERIIFDQVRKMEVTVVNEKFVIGLVWDEELKKVMQFGDQIIRVNDIRFEGKEMCDLIDLKQYLLYQKSFELEFLNNENEVVIITVDN